MICKNCGKETESYHEYCEDCKKQFRTEIENLTLKIEKSKENIDLYLERGDYNFKLENFENAIQDYSKIIDIDSENTIAYFKRGLCYIEYPCEDFCKAKTDFDEVIKREPKNAIAYTKRAICNLREYDDNDAISDFDKAIKLEPDNLELYEAKEELSSIPYCQTRIYENFIERNPDNLDGYKKEIDFIIYQKEEIQFSFKYDDDLELNEKYCQELLLKDYSKIIELEPDNADMYYNRGYYYYFSKKQYKEALADFDKAVELNYDDYEIYYKRGDCHYFLHNYEQAIKDYNIIIEDYESSNYYYPNINEYYFKRANCYENIQNYNNAIKDYSVVIKHGNDLCLASRYSINNDEDVARYIEAFKLRGEAYFEKKNYQNAYEDFSRYIQLKPDDLGAVYEKKFAEILARK